MERSRRIILACVLGALLGLLPSCTGVTRQQVLSYFLDDVDQPPPPKRRVRADLQREVADLQREVADLQQALEAIRKAARAPRKQEAALPIEKAKTWADAAALLPKGEGGEVDWVKALADGTIAPRSGFTPNASSQAVLDLDVELGAVMKAKFSHRAHTEILSCASCHPVLFKAEEGSNPISMAKIKAGQFCGACHGKVAFGVEKGCARCHAGPATAKAVWKPTEKPRTPIEKARTWSVARKLLPLAAGEPDWAKALADGVIAPRDGIDPAAVPRPVLPIEVELSRSAGPTFKAVFRHQTHTALLGCESCHTGLFQMKKGADAITMAEIRAGRFCGACHGKVAFAVEKGCARCHAGPATAKAVWKPTEKPRTPIEKARTWTAARKLLPLAAGGPDWVKALADGVIAPRDGIDPAAVPRPVLPIEVELSRSAVPAFKAVFRHQTHTALLGCESCHTGLFQMKRGADAITMTKIRAGQFCGACHGKVAFGVEKGCARCHAGIKGG